MARNPRAAAQRATAARVREARKAGIRYEKVVPSSFRAAADKARTNFADSILSGDTAKPAKDSREGRSLAALASHAAHGRAPERFKEFEEYWYHTKGGE